MAAFLIMEGLMNGVFAALDAMLFYVFFEGMLIPMFLIIGIWGGPNRVYATIKFFLYTFLGSVFMLVALIYLYLRAAASRSSTGTSCRWGMTEQTLIFLAFLAPSRSRCRCGRCTPGCRTPTSRRPPAAR
jgi:NADH-quinone oxidoreductase subunit M